MTNTTTIRGAQVIGVNCTWTLLAAPQKDARSPYHDVYVARAVAHLPGYPDRVVRLKLTPEDVLAWRMAGSEVGSLTKSVTGV